MFWHSSYDQDSGHQWLRKTVHDAAAEMQAAQASETVISSRF
jgi:hypothetical protein